MRMATHNMTRQASKTIFSAIGVLCLMGAFTACTANGSEPGDPVGSAGEGNTATDEAADSLATEIVGTWTSDEKGNPRLAFENAGTVTGTDGCNGISTIYTIEGDRVALEKFASTRMACQGVNDWLRSVREVTVDGDTLQVFNGKGDEIGTLNRES